jgi:hypothetical protein
MTLSELQNETEGHLQSLKLEDIRNQVMAEEGSSLVPFGSADYNTSVTSQHPVF